MFGKILTIIGIIFLIALIIFISYFTIATIFMAVKGRLRHKAGFKKRLKNFKSNFVNHRYINLVEFVKWIVIDILRGKDKFKLFGIWCFTGYYGEGKSLGAVNFALKMQKEHPNKNIKIYSNFDVVGQTGKIEKWEDLIDLPKNTIVIFDEIQSTFASSRFSKFPIELLWKLTQCRKHGLVIFCTSPVFSRMGIELRESTDYVVSARNMFGFDRMFVYEFYRADKYVIAQNITGVTSQIKKRQLREFKYTLVAQDKNYSYYDTSAQIDRWDIEEKEEQSKSKKLATTQIKKIENKLIKLIESKFKEVSNKI
ncbi:zonular occludens toxin domain-containing protein [Clostridiaceae bacterium M8S5]|nr:zonular occludens toxin domain-containing protein [Clostridiaceae bacterium M8S5]